MVIKISQPKSLNECGKRTNNEDRILPLNPTATDTIFIVCDGVGGAARGEMASHLVTQTVYQFIQQHFQRFTSDAAVETIVQGAVAAAERALNQYITQNPIAKGMGTTLTLLHLHEGGATIAHVGDSRIYHFRKDKSPFVTEDHSYVNEMVKSGLITHAQAYNHPNRNIITRAIQGLPERAVRADVRVIKNIQAGDYFFLCTDGVTEAWDDELLSQTLLADSTDDNKIKLIQTTCDADSQDNFSCFLIPVASVTGAISAEDHFPMAAVFEMSDGNSETSVESSNITMLPQPNYETHTDAYPINHTGVSIAPIESPNSVAPTPPTKKPIGGILRVAGLLAITGGAIFAGIQIGKDSKPQDKPALTTTPALTPASSSTPVLVPKTIIVGIEKPVGKTSVEAEALSVEADTHRTGNVKPADNKNTEKKNVKKGGSKSPAKLPSTDSVKSPKPAEKTEPPKATSTPTDPSKLQEAATAAATKKAEQEAAKKAEEQQKAEAAKKLEEDAKAKVGVQIKNK
jgi:PPM family protein phosphatase